MPDHAPVAHVDDDLAEQRALAAAVAVAEADPRRVPHAEVRAWLLRLANGELDALTLADVLAG